MLFECKKCNLCNNQQPMMDCSTDEECDVMWVGISAKMKKYEDENPLDKRTQSGKLIHEIEKSIEDISFYKTNLVKCPPLKDGKLAYPSVANVENCFKNLEDEIEKVSPKIVFLLGLQNANYILKKYGFNVRSFDKGFSYKSFLINKTLFVPIHHPSYISVYKRNSKKAYLDSISKIINLELNNGN